MKVREYIEGQRSHLRKSPSISTHQYLVIEIMSCKKEGVHISNAGAIAELCYGTIKIDNSGTKGQVRMFKLFHERSFISKRR